MRFLVTLLLLTSCAQEISELGDFPCPENNECPDGRVCAQGMCVVPTLGSECHADFGDSCSAGPASTGCFELDPLTNTGRCEHGCNSNDQCATGYCSSGAGICLDDCSANPVGCGLDRECVVVASNQSKCVPLIAPHIGELCSSDSQCAVRDVNTFCFKSRSTSLDGICAPLCTDDASCSSLPGGPYLCATSTFGGLGCLLQCSTTCENPSSFSCEIRGASTGPVCSPIRVRDLGQHCVSPSDCTSKKCGGLDGQRRCTQSCTGDDNCPVGFSCIDEQGGGKVCWPQASTTAGCTTIGSGSLWMGFALLLLVRRRRRS